jgi:hypothetical protein
MRGTNMGAPVCAIDCSCSLSIFHVPTMVPLCGAAAKQPSADLPRAGGDSTENDPRGGVHVHVRAIPQPHAAVDVRVHDMQATHLFSLPGTQAA